MIYFLILAILQEGSISNAPAILHTIDVGANAIHGM